MRAQRKGRGREAKGKRDCDYRRTFSKKEVVTINTRRVLHLKPTLVNWGDNIKDEMMGKMDGSVDGMGR